MKEYAPFVFIILILVIILGLSSQSNTSSNYISNAISNNIQHILIKYNNYNVKDINIILRKLAHFTEYIIFSSLLLSGVYNVIKRMLSSILITGMLGILLAFIDEEFQLGSLGRNSSLFDVMIDSIGVIIGLSVISIFILLSGIQKK